MKYNPKKEDFYILKTKFNESYRDELYDDGLNLCFQGNEEKSNDNNDFPDNFENPFEERYDYADNICAEYRHLHKLVKRLQVELSSVFCPNSRIKELFGSTDVIEGTAYSAILDEVDSIISKIDVNKKSLKKDIENSIKEFLSFVHSTELAIYQNFDIMQINEPEYDSVQSYLFDVSDRFTVLGETVRYFFGEIYDIVSDYNVKILDRYKETIEGFLYPDSGNIHKKAQEKNGNQCEKSVVFQFDDKIMGEIHKLYNKCVEFENDNVCSKSKFVVMFEEADFSTTLKENGNVPAFVCYVIYYFQTYICDKGVSREWFKRACSSVRKSEESTRSSAHKSKYWGKK